MILSDFLPLRTLDELNAQTETVGTGLLLHHSLPLNTEPWTWLFA